MAMTTLPPVAEARTAAHDLNDPAAARAAGAGPDLVGACPIRPNYAPSYNRFVYYWPNRHSGPKIPQWCIGTISDLY